LTRFPLFIGLFIFRCASSVEQRKVQKEEQQNVAQHCKQNPKAFWNHINSKRKTKTGIGDLHIVYISGNSATVSSNKDKAEDLGKFFSSVFTVEQEQSSSFLPVKPCHSPIKELVFNEQIILEKTKQIKHLKVPRARWYSSPSTI